MLVVRVTENVRAVQSSYYSSCPCIGKGAVERAHARVSARALIVAVVADEALDKAGDLD
jgi:hypothetical protein